MLYVVECAYTDPQSETAWNTFYNQEKLPALVSVPGFYASQRFRALNEECPATWRCTISTMLPSSTATPTAATVAAILPAGNRRSPTGTATSMLQIAACGRSGLMRCSC